MTNIFFGNEAGYGSVIKVLADASIEEPLSVSDDEYDQFRFNSKRADISPIMEVYRIPKVYTPREPPFSPRAAEVEKGRSALDYGGQYQYNLPKSGPHGVPFLPMFQVHFTGGDGWNYPDHWVSVRPGRGGGNNWGNRFLIKGGTGRDVHFLAVNVRFGKWALAANQHLELVLFDFPDRLSDAPENQQLPWAQALPPKRGQLFWQIDKKGFEVARPGYDLETATEAQKILGDVPKPLLYYTKRVVLAPGETKTYTLPPGTPDDAVCLCQWNAETADHRFLPSMWVGPTSGGIMLECRWKIGGERLTIENMRPDRVEYLLIVVGRKPHKADTNNAWDAGIDANGERYMRFNRNGYVQLDTRYGYLPIIKSGVIENPKKGEVVRFPKQGYKPYVLASISFNATFRELKQKWGWSRGGNFWVLQDYYVTRSTSYSGGFSFSQDAGNVYGAETFAAKVYQDRVVFDFAIGSTGATGQRLAYTIIGVPSFD